MTREELIEVMARGEVGREIEVAIYYALAEPEPHWTDARWADCLAGMNAEQTWRWLSRFRSEWTGVTTSLDAAVALVERVRPGWGWSVSSSAGHARANVWNLSRLSPMPPHTKAPTPAAALVAALLKAMGGE